MGWVRLDLCGARLAFTDRRGGVSAAPYDTLNLGFTGDDRAAVLENRRRAGAFVGAAAADPSTWVPLRQVHGAEVVVCGEADVGSEPEGDAVVVAAPGRTGVVLVADCLPLALVSGGAVAAVHVGWRGLRAGVVERALAVLRDVGGDVRHAVVGPCIRACCYEFGEEDLASLVTRYGEGVRGTTGSGRPALDLPAGVREALVAGGVRRVLDLGECTACSPDYFSHRRDGVTGRQGLLVTRLA